MRVGAKRTMDPSRAVVARTKQSLNYALARLQYSELSPYICQVFLYGSCARKKQTYKSDVDLFVVLKEGIDIDKFKAEIINLKGTVSPTSLDLPEVDMHVTVGNDWQASNMLYYKNIRKDGVELWERYQKHI